MQHSIIQEDFMLETMKPRHAIQLEALQRIVFPTLAEEELILAKHYLRHLELFPEGQFVITYHDEVIGATTTMRANFDFDHYHHTFNETIAGGWLTNHDPAGVWLYGLDVSIHPDFRRRGLATVLYDARQQLVNRLGLQGQITVGMMNGYGAVASTISGEEYYTELIHGKRVDPTVSTQIKVGFKPIGLIPEYLNDPSCGNYGVMLVWEKIITEKTITEKTTMAHIELKTAIPGPKALTFLERRKNAIPAGLAKSTEVVVDRAEGCYVYDVDGNRLLDFAGGIGMINVGHCPQAVSRAIADQASRYIHTCSLVTTFEPYIELAETLNAITPGDFAKKTLLANSGSEAVENAVNIAKYYTKRNAVICFEGAYHGRTLLTLSLTSKYGLFKKGFGSYVSDIYRLPAPNMYRVPNGMSAEDYLQFCIKQLDHALIAQVDPSAIAAIIIEPIQGEAGFIPMPKAFLAKIRSICDQHGIVMIADEIQSGFGRTGKLFAINHYEIIPDLMTMAKSMGAGMPIAAVTGRADIMDSPHLGGVGGTFSGSPVACVAAIETIKIINTPEFLDRATAIGELTLKTLTAWKEKFDCIGDVRGVGAMCLVEFVKDRDSREPDPDTTVAVMKEAISNGLILIRAGLFSNCIRLLMPLVMTDEQLIEGLAVLEKAIALKGAVKVLS